MRRTAPRTQTKVGSTVAHSEWVRLADAAFASGQLVGGTIRGVGILAVPAARLVEMIARGIDMPAVEHRVQRDDGATVVFYAFGPDGGLR